MTDRKGNSSALGLCCCTLVLSLILRWYLGILNQRKEKSQHTDEAHRQRQESLEELGDRHPGKPISSMTMGKSADTYRILSYNLIQLVDRQTVNYIAGIFRIYSWRIQPLRDTS